MDQSPFNLVHQNQSIDNKIVVGLERMAEVFKSLQWQVGKELQLSPIQIQILLFVEHHQESLCTVSHLAKELNLTKPTISDAVRVLYYKDLVDKFPAPNDSRSFSLKLNYKGKRLLEKLESYIDPILQHVKEMEPALKLKLWESLSFLIFNLNKTGVLQVQRMCFKCRHYEKSETGAYCQLLKTPLRTEDIRIDCPEFEEIH